MRSRRDGLETRGRILDAARNVFAAKGYRDATVAEICRSAQANVAAVNYHFGDKDSLYREVWRSAMESAVHRYPISGGVEEQASLDERFRGTITALLLRMGDGREAGNIHQLRLKEFAAPTGLVDRIMEEFREPVRERLLGILREYLGDSVGCQELEDFERSIVGQCVTARNDGIQKTGCCGSQTLPPEELKRRAEHIVRFSLPGLLAFRRRNGTKPG